MSKSSPEHFFDQLAKEYTVAIERCFPRYGEMLTTLLRYLPNSRPLLRILELGCGTGNLSVLLTRMFPESEFYFVDVSQESLDVCAERLASHAKCQFIHADFRQLSGEFHDLDLIVSSIAVHHVNSADKKQLFQDCYRWLGAAGILAMADQFRGETESIYATHIQEWRRISLAAGSSDTEFEMWMEHQRLYDHHDTLVDHIRWLTESGFNAADCLWRYLLWGIIQATKPPTSV